MLALTVKPGDEVTINDEIRIVFIKRKNNVQIVIGIGADKNKYKVKRPNYKGGENAK